MSKRGYILALVLVSLLVVACDQRTNTTDPTNTQGSLTPSGQVIEVQTVEPSRQIVDVIAEVTAPKAIQPVLVEAISPISERPSVIVSCFVDTSLEFVDQLICNVTHPDRALQIKSVVVDLKPQEQTEHQGPEQVELDPRLFGYNKDAVVAELPKSYFPATITVTVRLDDREAGYVRLLQVTEIGDANTFGVSQPLQLGLADQINSDRD